MRILSHLVLAAGLGTGAMAAGAETAAVLDTSADIAEAAYTDSLRTARRLAATLDTLRSHPSPEALEAARQAWAAAHVSYQQTEAFSHASPIMAGRAWRVDGWPLDEGLIDYVDASYAPVDEGNPLARLNVIATEEFPLAGETFQAGDIIPALLSDVLHRAEGAEANIASGYHAIEFLLWGQDLNGTEDGSGRRGWTDFVIGDGCSNGNCYRRLAYLRAASDLLIADLEWMTAQWAGDGAARQALMEDPGGVSRLLAALATLAGAELAERGLLKGLALHDPEWEEDDFSDLTHRSMFYAALGLQALYTGAYSGRDGALTSGPSLSELVAGADAGLDTDIRAALDEALAALTRIKASGDAGVRVDQMLAPGNAAGAALLKEAAGALSALSEKLALATATPEPSTPTEDTDVEAVPE